MVDNFELSWGSLEKTVLAGILPWDITVQVINSKKLTDTENGARYRLILWDGVKNNKNAMFATERGEPCPENFSIIRIGTETVPDGTKESKISRMDKGGVVSYAYIFFHYNLIKAGSQVSKKILKPTPTDAPMDEFDTSAISLNSTLKSPTTGTVGSPSTTSAVGSSLLHTPPNQTGSQTAPPPYKNSRSRGGMNNRTTPAIGGDNSASPQLRRPNPAAVKRNLIASYPPENKRQNVAGNSRNNVKESETATHQVAGLNPMMNRYSVKVRVSEKKEIKDIQSAKWQGKVASCKLSDNSGDIMLKGFNESAVSLHEELKDGCTYLLTGAKVVPVRDVRYNNTGHNYELSWNNYTKVILMLHSTVSLNYKFKPISCIQELEAETNIDVCGWVKHTGDLIQFTSKNDRELKKREVVLMDDSSGGLANTVTLTLWDKMAVEFNSHNRVIALKGAKVSEWNNEKNLKLGFTGSYEVEPDVPGVQDLVEWSATQAATQPAQNISSGIQEEFTTIKDLKDYLLAHKGEKKCRIYGWITYIAHENITYRAHTPKEGNRCQKKVLDTGGRLECRCGKKNIPEEDTTLRFMLRMCLADCTESAWCVVFDAAPSVLNKSADQINTMKEQDEAAFQDYISRCSMKAYVFTVGAKIETYNDAPQLKLIVNQVDDPDWDSQGSDDMEVGEPENASECVYKSLARALRNEVAALENELGVDHKDVVNTTWNPWIDNL